MRITIVIPGMTSAVRRVMRAGQRGPARRDRPRGESQMRFYRISFLIGLATGYVLGAQATARTAKDKATTSMRKGASKVTRRANAGRDGASKGHAGASTATTHSNGAMPRTRGSDDNRPFVPADPDFGQRDLT